MLYHLNNDTIVAIATPPGKSALGIIRVSGNDCFDIVNKVFSGKDLTKVDSHTIHYGFIKDLDGNVLDEVLLNVYKSPKTYTGENLIEISCHGSMYILNEVLSLLQKVGARLAQAGEFTLRAFMNKKLDLSQAEAVIDMIDSENEASHKIAVNQIRGGFSDKIKELREKLLNLISLFELELDFGEEDVEFASNDQLKEILNETTAEVKTLVDSFKLGNVIKQGVSVVIAGRPNAGKSTLLNELLQEERAITSNIPGTTRDFIEDTINIDGILFRFVDTAGLTSTTLDLIEKEGIQRTLNKIKIADLVIYLFDITELTVEEVKGDVNQLELHVPHLLIANKIDKDGVESIIKKDFSEAFDNLVFISSKFQQNISALKVNLLKTLDIEKYQGDLSIVTNTRHYTILSEILRSIEEVNQGIDNQLTKDFITIDIRKIIQLMGEITGEITNDEILGNIFGRFCIGK
ncbi:MAG: tRNA uridine-5-carboxymethylaminomethyl(34) synthesis GTPase MnmE [Bacteroidetes bacterium]|nr:tRNA uridine-5-carboxymethylaminomethyl(34) synthesis GTPase MnmE [Bacteroidota bacterium]MBT5530152.1 tRNA uridine-5-carboxymethylaminomethyl(34) synthesis GTPase MnmE [Cytophagia bacterium]MBT3801582.1 tRNA uridine-5-carboxymethylaminomethyl(34) synthesis GTPase MnmE [Bacteroidota bacterium]MBT4337317.1 tRNA uridine-5-carboxymethylaminomethyl(34) synthesis GTPase MnmE [Bacteroidota bacterium]MBT4726879.1 tRNA uridine-5-carboxymethylaminomethyl(34) synthesis GTPase MnmE [Bacteroidota bacter